MNMKIHLIILTLVMFWVTSANSLQKYSKYSKSHPYPTYSKSAQSTNAQQPTAGSNLRGFGVSAWGLVFLIVSIILTGVGAYYVAIFYPLICKKERNYDRMELTAV